ncbi:hypothetical protein RBB78_24385 [Tunturiibacter empetritectus]|uniref:hypothetical protein n=1 Tax=Tunturiibacter empetritectus TaxID=3069691 RepID=UPI003D9B3F3F
MEIDVGVENGSGEWIVDALEEVFVLRTMFNPEGMEVYVLGKGSEERENVDDLGGVGRQLCFADDGGEAWGR